MARAKWHPTMNTGPGKALFVAAMLWLGNLISSFGQVATNFVNFETAPVHPVAVSPDGKLLAVCNLPDSCVEIFDLTSSTPRRVGSVFTGVDPVTARFRSNSELWVINHISDSISIIDPIRLITIDTLDCFDAPADVVFTTNPSRAFVSHSGANLVEIWNAETRESLDAIDIEGDRPKAMAMAADESEIYIAILESGNSSTIITAPMVGLERTPPHGANDLPDSPQAGLNPFPNSGDIFDPIINPAIPSTSPPPRVGVIVRKQNGRWLDDNKGDWTQYISGTNAFLTDRIPGWDIADHDLAVLNVKSNTVRYVRGLMNICFDVAVNPVSGKVNVIGTDSINEVRFEPNLKSIFARMKLATVDPANQTSAVRDLNPHLDYKTNSLPAAQRRESVGEPRAIAWNSRGTRAFVAGMGSNNLTVFDENGDRVGPAIQLPDGPTGLAFDAGRNRLYIFCRFASKLVTLDAESLAIISTTELHDSTPEKIRKGRKHFYNTVENSGLGQVSCASCHIDGRFDRLAWDLGDQTGDMISATNRNFRTDPERINDFHPMKGPMVTQTLQDIIGHEPFHWRADRVGIEEFAPTFKNLQGRDEELSESDMQEFKDFLASIAFPPNPNRNLDNTLPTALNVGEKALGRGARLSGQPLPIGDAQRGMILFRGTASDSCLPCHSLPTGLGPDARFLAGRWQNVPLGPKLEHHVAVVGMRRTSELPFKIQQLRNLHDKLGFDLQAPVSRAGFGFFHDGRVDSLTRFLQDGFDIISDQDTADLIAFLLAFTGSDLPQSSPIDPNRVPGLPSRDAHAAVGLQTILTNNVSNQRTLFMMSAARGSTSRVDLVVHGMKSGVARSWLLNGTSFVADKAGETNTSTQLFALATPETPLTFTLVQRGTGKRIALDRDDDTFFNQDEIAVGSDPSDSNITPDTTTPRLASFTRNSTDVKIEWFGRIGSKYRIQSRATLSADSAWADLSEAITITANPTAWSEPINAGAEARFYQIVHVP
jgi:DNA-binding beta-propeller fold protein YncE